MEDEVLADICTFESEQIVGTDKKIKSETMSDLSNIFDDHKKSVVAFIDGVRNESYQQGLKDGIDTVKDFGKLYSEIRAEAINDFIKEIQIIIFEGEDTEIGRKITIERLKEFITSKEEE